MQTSALNNGVDYHDHRCRTGLYLACLLKRSGGDFTIQVVEQNRRDSTFGLGSAFSHRALESLRSQDAETWAAIWPWLEFWDDSIVSLNGPAGFIAKYERYRSPAGDAKPG